MGRRYTDRTSDVVPETSDVTSDRSSPIGNGGGGVGVGVGGKGGVTAGGTVWVAPVGCMYR